MRSKLSIAVLFFCTLAAPRLEAQVCPGDCDSGLTVTVDEIVRCVNIALGSQTTTTCARCDVNGDGVVTVDEIVRAVITALGNFNISARGMCMRPGATDLVACAGGTQVKMSRCRKRNSCLEGDLDIVGNTVVGAGGEFELQVSGCQVAGETLVFEAPIDQSTKYRAIDFGPVAQSGAGSGADIRNVVLSPTSEAAVRLLDERGLENFDDESVLVIIDLVDEANDDTDFGGLTPEQAVLLALDVARNDPPLRATATARQFTPTPTVTSAVPPTNTPSTVTLRIGDVNAMPGQTVAVPARIEYLGRPVEGFQHFLTIEPPDDGIGNDDASFACAPLPGPACSNVLALAASAADATVTLSDGACFPPDGGLVQIGDQVRTYVERQGNILLLTGQLSVAFPAGTPVTLRCGTRDGSARCTATCTNCTADFVLYPPGCVAGIDCFAVRATVLNLTLPPQDGVAFTCDVEVGGGVSAATNFTVRVADIPGGDPCFGATFVAEGDDEQPLGCSDGRITVTP
jgi:hypothetical protein